MKLNHIFENIFSQYNVGQDIPNTNISQFKDRIATFRSTYPPGNPDWYVEILQDIKKQISVLQNFQSNLNDPSSPKNIVIATRIKQLQEVYTEFAENSKYVYFDTLRDSRQKQAKQDFPTYANNTPKHSVRPADVPTEIHIPGEKKQKFTSPYYVSGVTHQYVGSPAHYTEWTTPMKTILMALVKTLKQLNKPPLLEMVAGRYNGGAINFAVYNPSKTLIWRKYDTGGGTGQNWMYINGNKIKTSDFMYSFDEDRMRMLKDV